LTCDRKHDDGTGTLIENVVADDEYGTNASLFAPADGIEIGPPNLAS
jgi:hypothetical protein